MDKPLILIIDDSHTIRKMVECHLSQAGYRVAMAVDADQGIDMARSYGPRLILLDHQLPGTTGEEVCKRLLDDPATASIPVIISSAMRNRAYARYTEYPNVVDQIPKPFTPELLKSGVANGLQMGDMVVQAQRTGCAMPEAVGEANNAILEGTTGPFSLRALVDFLNNCQQAGRLTVEADNQRVRWALAGGRVQAVYSPTLTPETLEEYIPADIADLAPLLAVTLGEQQDSSMAGMVKLLEKSLSDPRRLRALLRFQASALTYGAMIGMPGKFTFEPVTTVPPMFQAFPLQLSLPALLLDGLRHCDPEADCHEWGDLIYARQSPRGGNPDRSGLSAAAIKVHTLLDGVRTLGEVAQQAASSLAEIVLIVRGLELASLVEKRAPRSSNNILVLDDDPEAIRVIRQTLGPEGSNHQVKIVQDRVAAQLLLRRQSFQLVMLAMDRPDQEGFFRACKEQHATGSRYVGILKIDEEGELARLDAMGLDGVVQRPVNESDLVSTVNHLMPSALN